jgi:hypothetical protein
MRVNLPQSFPNNKGLRRVLYGVLLDTGIKGYVLREDGTVTYGKREYDSEWALAKALMPVERFKCTDGKTLVRWGRYVSLGSGYTEVG